MDTFFTQGDFSIKPQYQFFQCPVFYPNPILYIPYQYSFPLQSTEVSSNPPQPEIQFTIVKKDNKKYFNCGYKDCDKSYKSKENLILHYRNKHLSEKPYHCEYCSVSFSHRNGKTYHERKVHTLIFPHKCTFPGCELKFASKSALTYHMKRQHPHDEN